MADRIEQRASEIGDAAWQRKLGRIRLGAEPVEDQLKKYRGSTIVLSIVMGVVGLMLFALFSAFRSPGIGARHRGCYRGPGHRFFLSGLRTVEKQSEQLSVGTSCQRKERRGVRRLIARPPGALGLAGLVFNRRAWRRALPRTLQRGWGLPTRRRGSRRRARP